MMDTVKVLFLGNSHTYYNDLPALFRNICRQKGKNVEVSMLAHPGVTYKWHLEQYTDLRFALVHGGYDYIIMQQAAHEPCPSKEETIRDAKRIIEMASKQGVKAVQTLPWARKDIPQEQNKMDDIYFTLTAQTGILLNPVGKVFEYIRNNCPDIELHWFDGAHMSPYGTYVNALCTYATLFDAELDGISDESFDMYPIFGEPDVTDKEKLKITLDPYKTERIKNAVKMIINNN